MFQFIRSMLGRGVVNTSPAELKSRLAGGEQPIIIDVRSQEEYDGGHIPGARLIPLDRLAHQVDSLNPDDEILLVCRGGMMAWDGPVV